MTTSWPILLGIFAVVVAAFWYDANVASAGSPGTEPQALSNPGSVR